MIKSFLSILGFVFFTNTQSVFAQTDYFSKLEKYQRKLNEEFKDKEESPLEKRDRRHFEALDFFQIDTTLKIVAKFIRTKNQEPFEMRTTTERKATYEKYGEAHFSILGEIFKLNIYQNHRLRALEEYKNHLFLPFKDNTNGNETYGGGRYIDLTIPTGETIEIDFNKAYNPYCAYSHRFSCPIVPTENSLNAKIKAGVKVFNH